MALIRTALLGGLIYLVFALAYPDYTGSVYHVMVLSVIAGGAVGMWFLHKLLDLGEGAAKLGVEAVFLCAVAAFIGFTMPQKSGKPPFEQWSEGVRPNRDNARRGLDRLGVDSGGAVGSRIVKLFPK